jgi:tetratricopeptide (TPR) repeat protein
LINQFDQEKDPIDAIRQYEASLDLMALQILVRLPKKSTSEDKIREINHFIFQEMQFRFPPHSIYARDIDLFTFLPSVLDSRQGVCLGVSILYLCLAQRLDLPLEIVTPPGHIYLRYPQENGDIINIETTARGINLRSEAYLGINTRALQLRTMKEVIGLAFINQAAVYWGKEDYQTTVTLYEKSKLYIDDDPLLKMFLGFNYLFVDRIDEGKKLLHEICHLTSEHEISQETIPEDYLNGRVDIEGIKIVFLHVDETRASVLEKQQKLQTILQRFPNFRTGLLQLAITWLQLGRGNEALEVLERYHRLDSNNPIVEYYLSIICLQRFDYLRAWQFFKRAESIVYAKDHRPEALKNLKNGLRRACPEPS